jgi:hypothetical protein
VSVTTRAWLFTYSPQRACQHSVRQKHPGIPETLEYGSRGINASSQAGGKYQADRSTERNPEGLGTAPTSEVIDDDATTLLV